MMSRKTRYVMTVIAILLILCSTSSCFGPPITYTYDELKNSLIKVEIVNYSVTYEPEYQFDTKVVKTLTAEECDYAISQIVNMEFNRTIGMEPNWPKDNVLVFYYPSYELEFSYSGWVSKATEKSETGVQGYNVTPAELEDLINYLLNN